MSFFDRFRLAISPERLEVYRHRGDGDAETIARYCWNVSLSEALYPTLQTLEVALRNTVHHAASDSYQNEMWFDGSRSPLRRTEKEALDTAKETLSRRQRPMEPGRIVAELNFGFWTSLFNRRYEQVLWPAMLKAAFPDMPRRLRTQRNLSNRFNDIRKLGNRVFHHERIIHKENLPRVHAEITEAIGWISPVLHAYVIKVDRFPHLHGNGLVEARAMIDAVVTGHA